MAAVTNMGYKHRHGSSKITNTRHVSSQVDIDSREGRSERSRTTHAAARAVRANETLRKDVTLIKNAVANLTGANNASINNLTCPKVRLLSFS